MANNDKEMTVQTTQTDLVLGALDTLDYIHSLKQENEKATAAYIELQKTGQLEMMRKDQEIIILKRQLKRMIENIRSFTSSMVLEVTETVSDSNPNVSVSESESCIEGSQNIDDIQTDLHCEKTIVDKINVNSFNSPVDVDTGVKASATQNVTKTVLLNNDSEKGCISSCGKSKEQNSIPTSSTNFHVVDSSEVAVSSTDVSECKSKLDNFDHIEENKVDQNTSTNISKNSGLNKVTHDVADHEPQEINVYEHQKQSCSNLSLISTSSAEMVIDESACINDENEMDISTGVSHEKLINSSITDKRLLLSSNSANTGSSSNKVFSEMLFNENQNKILPDNHPASSEVLKETAFKMDTSEVKDSIISTGEPKDNSIKGNSIKDKSVKDKSVKDTDKCTLVKVYKQKKKKKHERSKSRESSKEDCVEKDHTISDKKQYPKSMVKQEKNESIQKEKEHNDKKVHTTSDMKEIPKSIDDQENDQSIQTEKDKKDHTISDTKEHSKCMDDQEKDQSIQKENDKTDDTISNRKEYLKSKDDQEKDLSIQKEKDHSASKSNEFNSVLDQEIHKEQSTQRKKSHSASKRKEHAKSLHDEDAEKSQHIDKEGCLTVSEENDCSKSVYEQEVRKEQSIQKKDIHIASKTKEHSKCKQVHDVDKEKHHNKKRKSTHRKSECSVEKSLSHSGKRKSVSCDDNEKVVAHNYQDTGHKDSDEKVELIEVSENLKMLNNKKKEKPKSIEEKNRTHKMQTKHKHMKHEKETEKENTTIGIVSVDPIEKNHIDEGTAQHKTTVSAVYKGVDKRRSNYENNNNKEGSSFSLNGNSTSNDLLTAEESKSDKYDQIMEKTHSTVPERLEFNVSSEKCGQIIENAKKAITGVEESNDLSHIQKLLKARAKEGSAMHKINCEFPMVFGKRKRKSSDDHGSGNDNEEVVSAIKKIRAQSEATSSKVSMNSETTTPGESKLLSAESGLSIIDKASKNSAKFFNKLSRKKGRATNNFSKVSHEEQVQVKNYLNIAKNKVTDSRIALQDFQKREKNIMKLKEQGTYMSQITKAMEISSEMGKTAERNVIMNQETADMKLSDRGSLGNAGSEVIKSAIVNETENIDAHVVESAKYENSNKSLQDEIKSKLPVSMVMFDPSVIDRGVTSFITNMAGKDKTKKCISLDSTVNNVNNIGNTKVNINSNTPKSMTTNKIDASHSTVLNECDANIDVVSVSLESSSLNKLTTSLTNTSTKFDTKINSDSQKDASISRETSSSSKLNKPHKSSGLTGQGKISLHEYKQRNYVNKENNEDPTEKFHHVAHEDSKPVNLGAESTPGSTAVDVMKLIGLPKRSTSPEITKCCNKIKLIKEAQNNVGNLLNHLNVPSLSVNKSKDDPLKKAAMLENNVTHLLDSLVNVQNLFLTKSSLSSPVKSVPVKRLDGCEKVSKNLMSAFKIPKKKSSVIKPQDSEKPRDPRIRTRNSNFVDPNNIPALQKNYMTEAKSEYNSHSTTTKTGQNVNNIQTNEFNRLHHSSSSRVPCKNQLMHSPASLVHNQPQVGNVVSFISNIIAKHTEPKPNSFPDPMMQRNAPPFYHGQMPPGNYMSQRKHHEISNTEEEPEMPFALQRIMQDYESFVDGIMPESMSEDPEEIKREYNETMHYLNTMRQKHPDDENLEIGMTALHEMMVVKLASAMQKEAVNKGMDLDYFNSEQEKENFNVPIPLDKPSRTVYHSPKGTKPSVNKTQNMKDTKKMIHETLTDSPKVCDKGSYIGIQPPNIEISDTQDSVLWNIAVDEQQVSPRSSNISRNSHLDESKDSMYGDIAVPVINISSGELQNIYNDEGGLCDITTSNTVAMTPESKGISDESNKNDLEKDFETGLQVGHIKESETCDVIKLDCNNEINSFDQTEQSSTQKNDMNLDSHIDKPVAERYTDRERHFGKIESIQLQNTGTNDVQQQVKDVSNGDSVLEEAKTKTSATKEHSHGESLLEHDLYLSDTNCSMSVSCPNRSLVIPNQSDIPNQGDQVEEESTEKSTVLTSTPVADAKNVGEPSSPVSTSSPLLSRVKQVSDKTAVAESKSTDVTAIATQKPGAECLQKGNLTDESIDCGSEHNSAKDEELPASSMFSPLKTFKALLSPMKLQSAMYSPSSKGSTACDGDDDINEKEKHRISPKRVLSLDDPEKAQEKCIVSQVLENEISVEDHQKIVASDNVCQKEVNNKPVMDLSSISNQDKGEKYPCNSNKAEPLIKSDVDINLVVPCEVYKDVHKDNDSDNWNKLGNSDAFKSAQPEVCVLNHDAISLLPGEESFEAKGENTEDGHTSRYSGHSNASFSENSDDHSDAESDYVDDQELHSDHSQKDDHTDDDYDDDHPTDKDDYSDKGSENEENDNMNKSNESTPGKVSSKISDDDQNVDAEKESAEEGEITDSENENDVNCKENETVEGNSEKKPDRKTFDLREKLKSSKDTEKSGRSKKRLNVSSTERKRKCSKLNDRRKDSRHSDSRGDSHDRPSRNIRSVRPYKGEVGRSPRQRGRRERADIRRRIDRSDSRDRSMKGYDRGDRKDCRTNLRDREGRHNRRPGSRERRAGDRSCRNTAENKRKDGTGRSRSNEKTHNSHRSGGTDKKSGTPSSKNGSRSKSREKSRHVPKSTGNDQRNIRHNEKDYHSSRTPVRNRRNEGDKGIDNTPSRGNKRKRSPSHDRVRKR